MSSMRQLGTLANRLGLASKPSSRPLCINNCSYVGGGKCLSLASPFPIIEAFLLLPGLWRVLLLRCGGWGGMLCCLIATAGCDGGNPAKGAARFAEQPPGVRSLLIAEPTTIDLDEVPRGGRKQAAFSLTNPGAQTIELARIESSCPCLTMGVPRRLAPGEQVSGRVKVDLRDEPHFTGEVSVEIKGWTHTGELAFALVVEVKVPRPGAG